MSFKKTLFIFLPFLCFWLIDFYSKAWFVANQSSHLKLFLFHLSYYENHGIILGSFSNLPLILRTVFLTTMGISIVASFPLINYLIEFRSKKLLFGLSCIFSGILGNVVDRIIYGFVVDFVYFKSNFFNSPVFNFADFIQWIGYAFLLSGIVSEINFQIKDNEYRKSNWVNHKFQFTFVVSVFSLYLFISVIFFAFSFTFFKYSLIEFNNAADIVMNEYLTPFMITYFSLIAFIGLVILSFAKTMSHRIAGPIYAMSRYLNDTLNGKKYPFKLRTKDHFKDLEEPFTKINERINQIENENEIKEKTDDQKQNAA